MDISAASQTVPIQPVWFTDPNRINRLLFGVYHEDDIYDKFCQAVPKAMRAFAFRIPAAMRARNLIFVHVPRVAGVSIVSVLYGPRTTRHYSMRYYNALDPQFAKTAPSFALLRDPFDRFASSYSFVRMRGAKNCRLANVFIAETAHIATVDDYLSYLEERDDFSLDFVMRRQSWFVTDLKTGAPLVKTLFLYGEDDAALGAYLRPYGVTALPRLNSSERVPLNLTAQQRSRIERIYESDFALIAAVRKQRAWQESATRVAAE